MITFSVPAAFAVWFRMFMVWRRLMWSSLALHVVDPFFYLYAFGFGMGAIVSTMGGVPYMAWVVPGMACYAALFTPSFESGISAYARFSHQKTYEAILATPVRMAEITVGEMLWAASKGAISFTGMLLVGVLFGGVLSYTGLLLALPVLFIGALSFSAMGLFTTAYARGYDTFSYFFAFWITPNFLFSGVFFDLSGYPPLLQTIAWVLPMSHLVHVVRSLTAGFDISVFSFAGHMGYLVLIAIVFGMLAHRKLVKKLMS
jgi:lipooligosaccharide transport system permease protein